VTEIKSIPYRPLSHPFVERLIGTFDANIWITRFSGQWQISKTSCSISALTSTTIARILHWKGEHRIRLCHDQSQISARFDGNHTVEPSVRRPWLLDLICQKLARRAVSGRPGQNSQEIIRCFPIAVHFADAIVSLPPDAFPFAGAITAKIGPQ